MQCDLRSRHLLHFAWPIFLSSLSRSSTAEKSMATIPPRLLLIVSPRLPFNSLSPVSMQSTLLMSDNLPVVLAGVSHSTSFATAGITLKSSSKMTLFIAPHSARLEQTQKGLRAVGWRNRTVGLA